MKKYNNNFYSLKDVVATLLRVPFIRKDDISEVVSVWGHTNGSSKEESGTELKLGILLKLKFEHGTCHYVYLEGWNDYTGWGCQDGVNVYSRKSWFDDEYTKTDVEKEIIEMDKFDDFNSIRWENRPVDVDRWLKGETEVDIEYLKP